PGALHQPARDERPQAGPRPAVRQPHLRRILVLPAPGRPAGLQRGGAADGDRRGDAQALPGLGPRRRPELAARPLRPRALDLRRGRPLRPPRRRGTDRAAGPPPAALRPTRGRTVVSIARTEAASSGKSLLPEILEFTTSLAQDRMLLREDLVGSLAHLRMLAETGLVSREDARKIHDGLVALWEEAKAGTLRLPPEEDVHMAVEAELSARLGEVAGRLHTARSRNDQVALDLRLHVREQIAAVFEGLASILEMLAGRAEEEGDLLLPSYTHRQRAQPIRLAYWLAAHGSMFARDVEAFVFAYEQADRLPLGVGAIAGTGLPIDRETTRRLLRFSDLTWNGLDTVGDRDFALDFTYAVA